MKKWEFIHVLEPIHDANKIFVGMRGLPLHTGIILDLEDMGLNEHDIIEGEKVEPSQFPLNLAGGSWINGPDKPTDGTRISFAAFDQNTGKWTVTVFNFGEISAWTVSGILSLIDKTDSFSLILPIMEPRRVQTVKGLVFIG